MIRIALLLALAASVSLSAAGGAEPRAPRPTATAEAFAVRVLMPDGATLGTPVATAPPDTVSLEGAFSYPVDGSVVRSESATASASSSVAAGARGQATSEVAALSLFGGEITAARVVTRARASAGPRKAAGDTGGTSVSGLTVFGQAAAGERVPLGDWGTLELGRAEAVRTRGSTTNRFHAAAFALTIRLTQAHGALPAGSEIVVGYAEASAEARRPPPAARTRPRARPAAAAEQPRKRRALPRAPEPKRSPFRAPPVRELPENLRPRLTAGGYVYPVYGLTSWSDTFGAPRATTRWHHGEDIFAPLGAPVLAVAEGTVFSVGWNDIGGNRLWLRDEVGNQFYYAHLSAFSPLAVNGAQVNAGDVLGFVGNTGDAATTPHHLHFEIHPVSLLGLGYDGVVNPAPYLGAWEHVEDLAFPALRPGLRRSTQGWARRSRSSRAPQPGAILLQAADISHASGLDPRSLRRALAGPLVGG